MTLDEALGLDGSYDGMLEVSCMLHYKAARCSSYEDFSPEELTVLLATWIECQVSNGGWTHWMGNTTVEGLTRSVFAMEQIECNQVTELGCQALKVASIELPPKPRQADNVGQLLNLAVSTMLDSDEQKDKKLRLLTVEAIEQLQTLDDRFFKVTQEYMAMCKAYVLQHREQFHV